MLRPHSGLAPGREKINEHVGVLHSKEPPSNSLSKGMETLQSQDLKTTNKQKAKPNQKLLRLLFHVRPREVQHNLALPLSN